MTSVAAPAWPGDAAGRRAGQNLLPVDPGPSCKGAEGHHNCPTLTASFSWSFKAQTIASVPAWLLRGSSVVSSVASSMASCPCTPHPHAASAPRRLWRWHVLLCRPALPSQREGWPALVPPSPKRRLPEAAAPTRTWAVRAAPGGPMARPPPHLPALPTVPPTLRGHDLIPFRPMSVSTPECTLASLEGQGRCSWCPFCGCRAVPVPHRPAGPRAAL